MKVRIAQITCGAEASSIQEAIEEAAAAVGGEIVHQKVTYQDIDTTAQKFGLVSQSPELKAIIYHAVSIVDGSFPADAVFIATCFRCAEGAMVRNEIRRYIQERTDLPVVSYSFTENLSVEQLYTRMEILVNAVKKRDLLTRKEQKGLTAGIDSGSSMTKAVIMQDNEIIGMSWHHTVGVKDTAWTVLRNAMRQSGVEQSDLDSIGVTGYGRFSIGKEVGAKLIQEELTVNSKGTMWLVKKPIEEATIIDIGGMDNKVITIRDGIPYGFTMGGICAGASGRFLEMVANRLKMSVDELGRKAECGDWRNINMNSYCAIFGIQDLVTSLAANKKMEDVAAAACHSVAQQIYQQQLQEIRVRYPIIVVGGTSLINGLVSAIGEIMKCEPIVPRHPQFIGAVGAALLS